VYITGSNAYFMSGELATQLSGRYMELKMLPLSFAEFCSGLSEERQRLSKSESSICIWSSALSLCASV
jgi:predicted AAA+ superfamily ATPase